MKGVVLMTLIGLSIALSPLSANAQFVTAAEAFARLEQERASKPHYWMAYVDGAGTGLSWANVHLSSVRKVKQLYCSPGKMALNDRNYADIALHEYKKNKGLYDSVGNFAGDAVSLALFNGLIETFPCN